MPTLECPHCNHHAPAPPTEFLVGKTLRCPACSKTFLADEHISQSPTDTTNPDYSELAGPSQPPSDTRKPFLLTPLAYDHNAKTSSKRYPNLINYISILGRVQKVLFLLGLIFGGFASGGSFLVIALTTLGGENDLPTAMGALLLLLVGSVLYFSLVWLGYISAMAFIEFLRVVLDIENNTRKQEAAATTDP